MYIFDAECRVWCRVESSLECTISSHNLNSQTLCTFVGRSGNIYCLELQTYTNDYKRTTTQYKHIQMIGTWLHTYTNYKHIQNRQLRLLRSPNATTLWARHAHTKCLWHWFIHTTTTTTATITTTTNNNNDENNNDNIPTTRRN